MNAVLMLRSIGTCPTNFSLKKMERKFLYRRCAFRVCFKIAFVSSFSFSLRQTEEGKENLLNLFHKIYKVSKMIRRILTLCVKIQTPTLSPSV